VRCDEVDDRLLDIVAIPGNDRPRLFPIVRAAKPELGDYGRRVKVVVHG